MKYFGIDREVRAVDDITLQVNATRSTASPGNRAPGRRPSSRPIAAANRPPLNVVGGSVRFSFLDRDIHSLSPDEVADGPVEAPLLHHAGLDERAQSGQAGEALLHRLRAYGISATSKSAVPRRRRSASCAASARTLRARCLSARAFGRNAPAGHDRACHHLPARVHHRRRADDRARRGRAEGRADDDPRHPARDRLVDPVRHARHGGARQHRRPARHHVCGPAGGGGADRRRSSRNRATPTPRISSTACRASATSRRRRRLAARRRTFQRRRPAAGSIRAARWRWTSAVARTLH